MVGEVRSFGLIGAVELVKDRNTMEPVSEDMHELELKCEEFRNIAMKHGIIVRPILSTIAMMPPLVITKEEIDFLFEKFRLTLDDFQEFVQ